MKKNTFRFFVMITLILSHTYSKLKAENKISSEKEIIIASIGDSITTAMNSNGFLDPFGLSDMSIVGSISGPPDLGTFQEYNDRILSNQQFPSPDIREDSINRTKSNKSNDRTTTIEQ